MVYLILNYFLVSLLCFWAGLLLYDFFAPRQMGTKSLFHFLITGLIGFTCVGQWIIIFLPVDIFTLSILLLVCITLSVVRRKRLYQSILVVFRRTNNKPVLFYVIFLCLLLGILILNAGPVLMDDTGSYHIQMVKWIQQFGSVPGIANLHLRFGFNSSWFVSIALLNIPFQGVNNYCSLNGLLSVWICYYLTSKIFDAGSMGIGRRRSEALAFLILFFLCMINWPMIRGSATGANYDFISTCCLIVLFADMGADQNTIPSEWFIWPAFLFTVRMFNFPLLLLGLVFILANFKLATHRKISLYIVAGLFIVLPFLIRNIILSGYVFFPIHQLDFFSYDWKADPLKLAEMTRYIKYYNRVNPMFQSLYLTENLSTPGWIKTWFVYLFRFDRIMVIFSVAGYVWLLIRGFKINSRPFNIFFLVMICQLTIWFFAAPDPRFVYGSLLFGIFFGIKYLPGHLQPGYRTLKGSLLFASLFFCIHAGLKIVRDADYRNFVLPHPVPVPEFQKVVVGRIELHIPEKVLDNWNPRCYDIALPCLYKPDPRLEARGDHIRDGFRIKNPDQPSIKEGEYKISEKPL